jgi:hypothetical protein
MPLCLGSSSLIGPFLSSLIPKMNALPSCSTFVTIYQPSRRHTPEDLYSQQRRCDNLNEDQTLCYAVALLIRGGE